jgi:hypothetical protein
MAKGDREARIDRRTRTGASYECLASNKTDSRDRASGWREFRCLASPCNGIGMVVLDVLRFQGCAWVSGNPLIAGPGGASGVACADSS